MKQGSHPASHPGVTSWEAYRLNKNRYKLDATWEMFFLWVRILILEFRTLDHMTDMDKASNTVSLIYGTWGF